ncbi:MAG: DUF5596 domain-containing protein [Chloracidobacterium sp.]|nr:DUF5596 domain-containing protein [Chloracidobacterium sp.]
MANQGEGAEPFPPPPAALTLFPVHVILGAMEAVHQRHQELGVPDDVSWETLSYLGRGMISYRKSRGETGIHISRFALDALLMSALSSRSPDDHPISALRAS